MSNESRVFFSINANSINDHILGLILDHNHIEAYNFILKELVPGGFPEEFIYDILTGEKTIIDSHEGLALSFDKNQEFIHEIKQLKNELSTEYFLFEGNYYFFLDEIKELSARNLYLKQVTIYNSILDVISAEYSTKEKNAIAVHDSTNLVFYVGNKADQNIVDFILFYQVNIYNISEYKEKQGENKEKLFIKSLKDKLNHAILERNATPITISLIDRDDEEKKTQTFTFPKEIALAYICHTFEGKYSEAFDIWNPVSPSGSKMQGDSSFHTDFWLALNFPFTEEAIYGTGSKNGTHSSLFYQIAMHVYLSKNNNSEEKQFVFLSNKSNGKFSGKVVFPDSEKITDQDVLILPNANAAYLDKALKSGCVIVETGGKMSHIVMVTKNDMLPIIMIENAGNKFKEGQVLSIDYTNHRIDIKK